MQRRRKWGQVNILSGHVLNGLKNGNINCVFIEKFKRNNNAEGSLGEALSRVRTAF